MLLYNYTIRISSLKEMLLCKLILLKIFIYKFCVSREKGNIFKDYFWTFIVDFLCGIVAPKRKNRKVLWTRVSFAIFQENLLLRMRCVDTKLCWVRWYWLSTKDILRLESPLLYHIFVFTTFPLMISFFRGWLHLLQVYTMHYTGPLQLWINELFCYDGGNWIH